MPNVGVANSFIVGQSTTELTWQPTNNTVPETLENSQPRTPPPFANSQHTLPLESQSQIDYDNLDHERCPTTRIHHSAREQPSTCPLPTFTFDWSAHGIKYVPPPSAPNPNVTNSRISNIQHDEHDCLIIIDGSYQGTRGAADYRTAGIAFLIHSFTARLTYFGGRFLPSNDGENSAPVAEAEATLAALTFASSIHMKRPLIVHDNLDMTNFLTGFSSNTKQASGGNRYSRIKDAIRRITSYFDIASCSHIKSHTNDRLRLEENDVVDKLAVFFRKNPGLTLEPQILDANLQTKLSSLFPNAVELPTISCPRLSRQNGIRCLKCGSPGHEQYTCFLLKYSCIPRKSVFTRIQPPRILSFSESFRNPKDIDWENGPSSIDDCTYVHFVATMAILATRQSTSVEAMQAFNNFGLHYHYNYVNRKLVKSIRKSYSPCIEDRLSADTLLTKLAEDESKKVLNLAKLCELRHWKKAMQYIHREERVSPRDNRIEEEWTALHPQAPNPAEDELHIQYNPSSFKLFHIDREIIKDKIASWDVTNAGGLSGFTPALIVHFYNLTARQEDPQHLNPHFTSFLVFIEYLASGKLSDFRDNALNYRSVMINKNPPLKPFKARNISIGDAFMRLANYSVLFKSIKPARQARLISDSDLGSLVKNGVEKFVKTGQLAASENCLVFSCDMTKGYNNILRTITWDAIKQIDFQPLTQIFTYLYGTSPVLNYIIDPSKPVTAENIRKAILFIGLPQGDNLSGFLFSITLNYILQTLWNRHGVYTAQVGYDSVLDDIKIAIPTSLLNHAGHIISDLIITLSTHNFNINLSKSELYIRIPSQLAQQQTEIINTATRNAGLMIGNLELNSTGFSVCKVPIGTPAFIENYISNNYKPRVSAAFERFRHLWKAIDRIVREKYNTFFVFIRLCFSSRFTYWLRTLTPQFASPIASFIDEHTQTLIEHLYPKRPVLPAPDDEFREQFRISKLIEKLPLSKGGAGVPSLYDLVHFCHIASCAESFSYVSEYGRHLGIRPPDTSTSPDDEGNSFRERLYTGFTQSANKILTCKFPSFTPSFFILKANESYTNIQSALTTSFHTLLQTHISNQLTLPSYKGWFEGGKEQYTSFTLNSQVRHITRIRPPPDPIFKTVLSMRVLRPLFYGAMCRCGKLLDPCGHHTLRCTYTPYTNIHHGVRDGCLKWMQTYIRRQHNSPLKVVSESDSQCQCELSNYYPATNSLIPNVPMSGRRSDGVLWALHDPLQPWAIDFVQTQTTTDKIDVRLRELDKKYDDKVKIYSDSHPTIPRSRIVPFVFTSDGVLHPKTEEFMDWFICKAASTELQEAPSHEKISFRHAFLSSLQDKTASLITSRFETTLKEAHAAMFPLSQPALPGPVQYSDPPSTSRYLFDTQPTPSPPRPLPESITLPHPLAPRAPSSFSSTLLSQATASQTLCNIHADGASASGATAPRPQLTYSSRNDTRAPPSLPITPPLNPYARVYSTPAGSRRGHPDTRAPPGDVVLQHHRAGPGSVALPASSSMSVLLRGHLSRDGRRA